MGSTPCIDLAFPIVEGRVVPIEHAHSLLGAVKSNLIGVSMAGVGIHPLRGLPIGAGMLSLPRRAHLKIRLSSDRIPEHLQLAGKELRVDSCLLRIGNPSIEPLVPHEVLYARTVTLAKRDGEGKRSWATEADIEAAVRKIAGSDCVLKVLGRRTIRIRGKLKDGRPLQIPGLEVVVEGISPEVSVQLQSVGVGGRRAFGCGIFVNAGGVTGKAKLG